MENPPPWLAIQVARQPPLRAEIRPSIVAAIMRLLILTPKGCQRRLPLLRALARGCRSLRYPTLLLVYRAQLTDMLLYNKCLTLLRAFLHRVKRRQKPRS